MSASQVHNIPPADVYGFLHSRPEGLTDEEAGARLREVGPNTLASPLRFRWARALAKHFTNFFSLLLYVSAGACYVAHRLQPDAGMAVLGWALLAVALLNGSFAFFQEYRAERAMEELKRFLPKQARVRRNGQETVVLVEHLAPGDVLLLAEGDQVPADTRLVQSCDLLVNNAPLTGESRSLPLTAAAAGGRLLDSPNLAFAGCSILRGSGVGVVFATGGHTEFGRIAALSQGIQRPPSPLERETARMMRILTVIATAMGLLFFVYGLAAGRPWWVNVVFMMGIIVANVPEGLLPTFTLALSMASLRMARRNVLVKGLEAVESLGSMHVICTDKTGTLTKNELAITQLVDPTGNDLGDPSQLQSVLRLALIASEVRVQDGAFAGDPLDVAVAEMYGRHNGSLPEIIGNTHRHFPFDVERRREAGLFDDGREVLFAVKGAWESLRPLIGQIDTPAGPLPADEGRLAVADAVVHGLARQGLRVIALAYCRLATRPSSAATEESLERRLMLKGFLSLDDPIRPEVPDAVHRCREAGIRVILVTGDHPDTAKAVAEKCGILTADQQDGHFVLRGDQLANLREEELVQRLRGGVAVFARTTPEQKLKIVSALKRLGYVVGMTGDGVNDAPALKAADVGIAMGQGGTDVARESADIILLDNNFSSLVAGVEEGRGVFANMQKFTTYVLSSNVPEIVPYLLYILLPVPLALTVLQILSIDLGTDMIPAMGLGQEPPDSTVMKQPPRPPRERLLSLPVMLLSYMFLGVIQAVYSLFLFFLVLVQGGWHYGQELMEGDPLYCSARGVALATVILMQIGNLVGRRSARGSGVDAGLFHNKLFVVGIALEILFSWAILYFPPVQTTLGTGPVSASVYGLAWCGIPVMFGVDYLRKVLFRETRLRKIDARCRSIVQPLQG